MIMNICDDMLEFLYNTSKMTDNQFFDTCVKARTADLLERNDKQFNALIDRMDSSIDYSDVSQVKKCITKLIRMSARNRANLRSVLRRMSL